MKPALAIGGFVFAGLCLVFLLAFSNRSNGEKREDAGIAKTWRYSDLIDLLAARGVKVDKFPSPKGIYIVRQRFDNDQALIAEFVKNGLGLPENTLEVFELGTARAAGQYEIERRDRFGETCVFSWESFVFEGKDQQFLDEIKHVLR